MARSVTLATLRANAQLYADQRPGGGSAFISPVEYNRLVNLALAELYDRLVAARGHEYYETEDTSITTASGTATYSLPTDFYELIACDLRWTAPRLEPVPALASIADRYRFAELEWAEDSVKAFRLRGTLIEFFPTPSSATQVVLRYVPSCPELANDSDTFDGVNGWDRAVSLRVAIEARAIEKIAAGDLRSLYEAELERIDEMAKDRTASHAARVRDVDPERQNLDGWPWNLPPPV